MKALLDGDIIRYEVGFASETGWKAIQENNGVDVSSVGTDILIPPFDYVQQLLDLRIASILQQTSSDSYTLFLSEGKNFRYDIAKTKPYKGQRIDKKPWHFDNITAYMKGVLPCSVHKDIEADDAMAIEHTTNKETIVCTRDKDLRQVPGLFYSWELGQQPQYGPLDIDAIGSLELVRDKRGKAIIKGWGYAFFCSQLLTGDRVDNIPGCDSIGPVKAYEILQPNFVALTCNDEKFCAEQFLKCVEITYQDVYKDEWETKLLEQGQLLWLIRRLNPDGSLEMWRKDLYV